MQPAQPIKIKRKATDSKYKIDKNGEQTIWKCFHCLVSSFNKKYI